MKRLESLTDEQVVLMNKVRDEWLGKLLSNQEVSWQLLKEKCSWIYSLGKGEFKKKDFVAIVMDSPYATQLAINMLLSQKQKVWNQVENQVRNQVENQVWNQVWNQVENQVWNQVANQVWNQVENQVWNQVWNQVENQVWNQVRNQVWNQVRNQVWNQVWNQVANQVRNQVANQVANQVWNQVANQVWNQVENQVWNQVWNQVRNQELSYISSAFGLAYDVGWLSFYDFFNRIGLIKKAKGELEKYIEVNSLFYEIFYFDGFVFATRMPIKIIRNDLTQLSSTSEPAVQWRDGYKNHFIDGVPFTEEIWLKLHNKELTPKEAIALENIEQRTVTLRSIGYQTVMLALGGKIIDTYTEQINRSSPWAWVLNLKNLAYEKKIEYQLIEIDLKDHDKPARFIKVQWFTKEGYLKETLLRVSPDCKTAQEGLGWTFQDQEYKNIIES